MLCPIRSDPPMGRRGRAFLKMLGLFCPYHSGEWVGPSWGKPSEVGPFQHLGRVCSKLCFSFAVKEEERASSVSGFATRFGKEPTLSHRMVPMAKFCASGSHLQGTWSWPSRWFRRDDSELKGYDLNSQLPKFNFHGRRHCCLCCPDLEDKRAAVVQSAPTPGII